MVDNSNDRLALVALSLGGHNTTVLPLYLVEPEIVLS